jgi:hypothetical protein
MKDTQADDAIETEEARAAFRMKDLMEAIASQSDLKRSDLREAAGLVCEALGAALAEGRSLQLPGLGKITERRRETKPSGELIVARIKLAKPAETGSGASDDEE